MRRRDFLAGAPFLNALPGWKYDFPRDHFSHPAFQTEWWYYTGNLASAQGRAFGFELTFFRQAFENEVDRRSVWTARDVWMAHLALTDIEGKRFFHAERLNRSGPGLAGVDASRQLIWNGNWSCTLKPDSHRLVAVDPRFGFTLDLKPAKAPVVHGKNGVSLKGARPGEASHYISFTRLLTQGEIRLGSERFAVSGASWMDHEIFSGELDEKLAGWDWFSIQLKDSTELMLYRLRQKDGSSSEYSAGSFVDAEGRVSYLRRDDFRLVPGRRWKSYPVEWQIEVPSLRMQLSAKTRLDQQELLSASKLTPSYWEGAMAFEGSHAGQGYLEMTGYDEAIRFGRAPGLPAAVQK